MDEEIHSEKELLDLIEKYANGLLNEDKIEVYNNITILRRISRSISIFDISLELELKKSTFLLYFLDKFIRDLWVHLGADAPFDNITDMQIDISREFGKVLVLLIKAAKEETNDEVYNALNLLINYYLSQLTKMEKDIHKEYV
jgi:hypothetical protein